MNIVIAIDSFKGSLSSLDAGNAICEGIKRVFPDANILVSPVADGGEGTVLALTQGLNGELISTTVTGPLGSKVEATQLEEHIKNSVLVITGEGCLDGQSVFGKAPIGVARLAKKYSKNVIAFSGCVKDDAFVCNEEGIDAFFPILREAVDLPTAMEPSYARKNLVATVEQIFKMIQFSNKLQF